ncbi:hypothetical protein AWC38_SpisGene9520 [Stylophora pistillata]|uniref:Uncharacterized protein n=1 Tax=Stylophora pistillata TaxID=50429 RepID=A0A2B4S8V4_STYPI|nr:hypothetical protein AWC38_SpisGene9520 [Stylophora pistillata]
MPRRNRIPLEHRERIMKGFEDKVEDYLVVADTFGVNRSTVKGFMARYIKEGRIEEIPRGGRNNVRVDEEMRDCLEEVINENCLLTLARINSELRRRLSLKPEVHDHTGICLGMRNDDQLNFIVIKTGADSLYALIADGHYRPTSIGRDKWKSLIGPTASLQQNCNMEGFNAVVNKGGSKARVGIINNNENDCNSCNSRIGFGTGGHDDDSNTSGNEAMNHESSDNGGKHIKTMGYILVQ